MLLRRMQEASPVGTSLDDPDFKMTPSTNLAQRKPDWLDDFLWREIDANDQAKLAFDWNIAPPEGVKLSQDAWNHVPKDHKNILMTALDKRNAKEGSINNVYSFFFEKETSITRIEGAVNSMALINALLLTIPFAFMTSLNNNFYASLKDAMSECNDGKTWWGQTAEGVYADQLKLMSCSVYSCIVSLILAIVFLVFKTEHLSVFQKIKIRVLVAVLFITTVSTFIALLNLVGSIFDFYMTDISQVCDKSFGNGGKYGWPGNGAATLGFILAVYIMM